MQISAGPVTMVVRRVRAASAERVLLPHGQRSSAAEAGCYALLLGRLSSGMCSKHDRGGAGSTAECHSSRRLESLKGSPFLPCRDFPSPEVSYTQASSIIEQLLTLEMEEL